MKKEIKNNEVMNAVENTEVKNLEIKPRFDEETMQSIIDEDIELVPKNQRKKFDALSLEAKFAKILFYQDIAAMKEEAKIKNSVIYRVKEVFDKRHASIDDAREVIKFAQEFIDNCKQREIDKIDDQIQYLELMKQSLW